MELTDAGRQIPSSGHRDRGHRDRRRRDLILPGLALSPAVGALLDDDAVVVRAQLGQMLADLQLAANMGR